MRQQKWWAADLRKHLEAAQIKRAALFRNDATCKRLRFHDLRGTGLTWMAIRGDDALKIQQRAGHTTFDMTQKYIRTAGAVGEVIGAVFPPLPLTLLSPLNGLANRPNDPQAVDLLWRRRELKGILDSPKSQSSITHRNPANVSDRAPKCAIVRGVVPESSEAYELSNVVETALAKALVLAAEARRREVVSQIAGELQ